MANKIQIRRGARANLPLLSAGELAWCEDTLELYIGTGGGNVLLNEDVPASAGVPPALEPVSTAKTGATGWTGTGLFNLEHKTYDDSPELLGSGTAINIPSGKWQKQGSNNRYMRLNLRLKKPYEWTTWAPFYDFTFNDGTTVPYELFYVPSRGVYEGLLPYQSSKSTQTVINSLRWERVRPDLLNYGNLGPLCKFSWQGDDYRGMLMSITEATAREVGRRSVTYDDYIVFHEIYNHSNANVENVLIAGQWTSNKCPAWIDNEVLQMKLFLAYDIFGVNRFTCTSAYHAFLHNLFELSLYTEMPLDGVDGF